LLNYGQPIIVALLIFAGIAMLSFLPWLIYIYRKLGYFPVSTTLIVFSFIFYFLAAFLLTMLPLPESRHNCIVHTTGRNFYSLVPFQFVKDLLRESNVVWNNPATYVYLLKERAFFQAFFNLLLLMPLGVYLRYFFQVRKAWWKALLIVFGVTLMYEVTQVTGIYGIYDCPYRLFDVDDLLLNTTGGLLGFFIAPILLALFPSRASIQQKAEQLLERDEVRNMPILLATLLDIVVIQLVSGIAGMLIDSYDIWSMLITHTITLFLFLVIIPATWNGQTLGSKFMRFRYTSKRLVRKLTKRMLAIFLIYAITFVAQVLNQLEANIDSALYIVIIGINILGILMSLLLFIIIAVHIMIVLASKERRRFFFDVYSGLRATRKNPGDMNETHNTDGADHVNATHKTDGANADKSDSKLDL
jgi:glycopeptide antibiotics resistance protein